MRSFLSDGNGRTNISKIAFLLLAASLLFCCIKPVAAHPGFFAPLMQRLIQDGFSPEYIGEVYAGRPSPMFDTVAKTLRLRESKLNYNQFLKPQAMARAKRFLRNYEEVLTQSEAAYGVDRYVVVAILSVETRFGSYTGLTPTLDILSTFAVMDQKPYRDMVWRLLPARDRQRLGRQKFDRKLLQRSQWAYEELRALLTWAQGQAQKVRSYKGSLMGAIGWAQFLPSSLLRHGVDGNGDGEVDLFDPTDAIFSVANYLKAYGWTDAKTRLEKEKVIYAYNHSQPYVRTVLKIADRLQRDTKK